MALHRNWNQISSKKLKIRVIRWETWAFVLRPALSCRKTSVLVSLLDLTNKRTLTIGIFHLKTWEIFSMLNLVVRMFFKYFLLEGIFVKTGFFIFLLLFQGFADFWNLVSFCTWSVCALLWKRFKALFFVLRRECLLSSTCCLLLNSS